MPKTPSGCMPFLSLFAPSESAVSESESQPGFDSNEFPYFKKSTLITAAENELFQVLRKLTAGSKIHVLAMVRLADIIDVKKGTEKSRSYFNRISSKHIDFVLCDARDTRPILCIELDDSTHTRKNRQERDAFVDAALKASNVPLLRIKVQSKYEPAEIKDMIKKHL